MRVSRCAVLSPPLALVSLALTLAIWAWILSQPPAAFHDQGGLAITLIYFPIAGLGWIAFGLPAAILGVLGLMDARSERNPDFDKTGKAPGPSGLSIALGALGVLLSLAGLAAAVLTLLIA